MGSNFPKVVTVEEVAIATRISEESILAELERGNIPGFKIGKEWRILEDNFIAIMNGQLKPEKSRQMEIDNIDWNGLDWDKAKSIIYKWPDGITEEVYNPVYKTELVLMGKRAKFMIGYSYRESAGQDRRRIVVFMSNSSQLSPVVEFTGANDFKKTGNTASIIKRKDGRHIHSKTEIPAEYEKMPTTIYSDVVIGRYAANGLAVIAHEHDKQLMLRHAIIRVIYKKWAKENDFSNKTIQKSINNKRGALGKAIFAYFEEKKDNANYEEALELAKSIKPDSKFNKNHYAWYKNKAKQQGLLN